MQELKIGRWLSLGLFFSFMLFSGTLSSAAVCNTPTITLQPTVPTALVTALQGSTVTLSVAANDGSSSCTGNLAYQWQYLGADTFWHTFPASSSSPAQTFAGNEVDAPQNTPDTFSISSVLAGNFDGTNLNSGDNNLSIQVLITDAAQNKIASNTVTLYVVSSWWLPDGTLPSNTESFERGALLTSGDVMAIGDSSMTINVRNGTTDSWSAAGAALPVTLVRPTTTLLPTGAVLIAGGLNGTTDSAQSYLFTEGSPTLSAGVSMGLGMGRDSHTASLLYTGQVLVAGGNNDGLILNSALLYDPASQTWTATNTHMNQARYRHAATVLANGTVLVTGGQSTSETTSAMTSAEIYDPIANTWTAVGNMNSARVFHTSTLLPNGQVLIAGGVNSLGQPLNTAEIYDPVAKSFTPVAATMFAARNQHTATLMASGLVLIAGGAASNFEATSEYFDWTAGGTTTVAVDGTFTQTATMTFNPNTGLVVPAPVDRHAAWLVPNGMVVAAGGTTTGDVSVATAEKFEGYGQGTPAIPSAIIQTNVQWVLAGGASASATCGPVDPETGLSTQPGVTFAWTLVNASLASSNPYPHWPDTSTVNFTVGSLATGSASLSCLATSSLGIPVSSSDSLPIFVLPTVAITNDTANPLSATPTVAQGGEITFTAAVLGGVPSIYDYQWQYEDNGVWKNWGTGQTQSLTSAQPYSNNLPVRVLVSNVAGTVTAVPVTLFVVSAPSISGASASPAAITSSEHGGTATGPSTLSVSATGTGTLTYQWCVGSTPSTTLCEGAGAPGPSVSVNPPVGGTYSYYAIVTDTIQGVTNSVASNVVTLTVNTLPIMEIANDTLGYPLNPIPTVKQGDEITFTVDSEAPGYPASYTYQWQYQDNGVWKNWGTAAQQTLASAQPYSNNLPVQVLVTNQAGTVTVHPVTLYVVSAPSISSASASPAAITSSVNGGTATGPSSLSVSATGTGTLTYQWCAGSVASTTCTTPVGGASSVSVNPPVGGTYSYYAVVTDTINGVTNSVASNVVTLTVNSLPAGVTITNSTANQLNPTVAQGSGVTFTANIGAPGYPATYTYQWQYEDNGVWKNWGTAAQQTLASAQPYSNDLPVRVQVTNAAGTVTATPVTLYVVSAPSLSTASASPAAITSSVNGGTATGPSVLSVSATGTGTLTYQWCAGSVASTTCTTPVGALPSVSVNPSVGGTYSYYAVVTDTINGVTNSVASNVVTLTVNSLPTVTITNVTTNPNSTAPTIKQGDLITFAANIGAAGYPASYTYQWQYEDGTTWKNWGAGNQQSLTSAQPYSNDLPVRVQVTNAAGTVTATPVTLYVVETPSFTTQPASSLNVMSGGPAGFTAAVAPIVQAGASGSTNSVTYRWCQGATPSIISCTSPVGSLATFNPSTASGGLFKYYVQVTNTLNGVSNTIASNDVTLTVNVMPAVGIQNSLEGQQNSPSPTVAKGNPVTFSAQLSGSPYPATGYVYQWQYQDNGVWKNWGTASSEALSSAQTYSDNLPIQLIVTNPAWPGYVSAAPATSPNLAIGGPVTLYVVSTPTGVTVTPTPAGAVGQGNNVVLTASSTGVVLPGEALSYAWYKGTAPSGTLLNSTTGTGDDTTSCNSFITISGTGNNVLTINSACLSDSGSYYAVATDTGIDAAVSSPPTTSNTVSITVNVGTWTLTNNDMDAPRYDALSLMLTNNTFWVAGGQNDTSGVLNNDAIYDPETGTWSTSGQSFVSGPHLDGTATLLPNGNVLIAGGSDTQDGKTGIEFFNPSGPVYYAASTATLAQPTTQHVAALLPNQSVLLAGGQNGNNDTFYNNAYLFTPAFITGTVDTLTASAGAMSVARASSRAVTLGDGRILIVGGEDINQIDNAVDIYDTSSANNGNTTLYPASLYTLSGSAGSRGNSADFFAQAKCTNTTSPTPCLATARLYHTATLLNDGRVLVAGGEDNHGNILSSMEIWDPAANGGAGGFYPLASSGHTGSLIAGRKMHSAVLLANGKVLVFGGSDGTNALTSAEVVDPNWVYSAATPSASIPAMPMNYHRQQASSTLLPNGSVLTAGGFHPTNSHQPLTAQSGEIFSALEGYTAAPMAIGNSTISATTPAAGYHDPGDGALFFPTLGAGLQYSVGVTPPSGNLLTNYYWTTSGETLNSGQGLDAISFQTPAPASYANGSPVTTSYNIDTWVMNQYGFSAWLPAAQEAVINFCTSGCGQPGTNNVTTPGYQPGDACPAGFMGTTIPNCTLAPPLFSQAFGVANSNVPWDGSTNFVGLFTGLYNSVAITASSTPPNPSFPMPLLSPLNGLPTGPLTANTTFTLNFYDYLGNVVGSQSATVYIDPTASLGASTLTPIAGASVTLTPTFSFAGDGIEIGSSGTGSSNVLGLTTTFFSGTTITVNPVVTTTYYLRAINADGAYVDATPVTISPIAPVIAQNTYSQAGAPDPGGAYSYAATLTGDSSNLIDYTSSCGGTFTPSGPQASGTTVYFVPGTGTSCQVTATADNDPSVTTQYPAFNLSAPVITAQPQGTNACSGGHLTLSVTALYATNATYTWYEGSISVATGANLSTYSTSDPTGGNYHVTITNSAGSVNSSTVSVNVLASGAFNNNPQITSDPSSVSLFEYQAATLSVSESATGTLQYQWYTCTSATDNTTCTSPIAGAKSAVYTTPAFTATGSNYYAATVTDSSCTNTVNTSTVATVSVSNADQDVPPTIVVQPTNQATTNGVPATFTATASGPGTLNFTWYRIPWSTYQGNLTANPTAGSTGCAAYPVTGGPNSQANCVLDPSFAQQANDGDLWYVVVSNAYGSATSQNAQLTVGNGVSLDIASQPQSILASIGQQAAFSVNAVCVNCVAAYQWYVIPAASPTAAPTAISGANGATLTIPEVGTTTFNSGAITPSNGDEYYAVVSATDTGGSTQNPITSNRAALLTSLPTIGSICDDSGDSAWKINGNAVVWDSGNAPGSATSGIIDGESAALACGIQLTSDAAAGNESGSAWWYTPISTSKFNVSFNVAIYHSSTEISGYGGSAVPADGFAMVLADPTLPISTDTALNNSNQPVLSDSGGAVGDTATGVDGQGLGAAGIPGFVLGFDTYYNSTQSGGLPATDPCSQNTSSGAFTQPYLGVGRGEVPLFENPWTSVNCNIGSLSGSTFSLLNIGEFTTEYHSYNVSVNNGSMVVTLDGAEVFSGPVSMPPMAYLGFTGSTGGSTEQVVISNLTATVSQP